MIWNSPSFISGSGASFGYPSKEGSDEWTQTSSRILCRLYDANKAYIVNEEAAKMGLVVPFIRLLGYDPNLPKEVRPEYCADFVQGDGKKQPDRMDYAIFDATGTKPLMVFETKALGTDLASCSNQLARYIAQLPGLHFGVMTDGCRYRFYGDLENQNKMDKDPFFTFALDDPKTDWDKVAKFLTKFSRESFNAETLITEAENSRYRQEMIDKLAKALKSPSEDDAFMKWLTADIIQRKSNCGRDGPAWRGCAGFYQPTLLRVMSNDFTDRLREGLQRTLDNDKDQTGNTSISKVSTALRADDSRRRKTRPIHRSRFPARNKSSIVSSEKSVSKPEPTQKLS